MAIKKRLSMEELEAQLDYLEALPRFDLSPAEAASVIGGDPESIRSSIESGNCGTLRCYFSGRNLRISKASVLEFCGRVPNYRLNNDPCR